MRLIERVHNPADEPWGWRFWCPGCKDHHALPVEAGMPDGSRGWAFDGNEAEPTFSPSVLVRSRWIGSERVCHLFVRSGRLQYLGDCTHALAGQGVPMVDLDTVKD